MSLDYTGILSWITNITGSNVVFQAFIVGLLPGILTTLGSLPGLLGTKASTKYLDLGLGFSAGVMLVASFTSLLLPSIELGGFYRAAIGFIIGVLIIVLMDMFLPHEHWVKGYEGPEALRTRVRAVWLIVIAIIIHNLPEGMAVGSSTVLDLKGGVIMAIAIGTQDMPEGFAVAFPIAAIQKNVKKAFFISLFSGFSETLMAVVAALLAVKSIAILPYLLAFSAGAMIYVVSHEIVPETHRHGHEKYASLGLILGFLVMLWLDTTLG